MLSSSKPAPPTLPSNGMTKTPPSTPGTQVKQEAQQYPSQPAIQANYSGQQYPLGQPGTAQERAAGYLQQQFGPRAGASIAHLQNQSQRAPSNENIQSQQAERYIKQQQQAYIKQEDSAHDYHQTYNTAVPLKQSQVDGTADFREQYETEVAHRRALVAKHRETSDNLIREHVQKSQKALEGGGLMMPLTAIKTSSPRTQTRNTLEKKSSLTRAQGDAPADDEDDEDAINSALDDSDELDEAERDEDNVQNIMLCTYDKVQRVKNKWKCTLKDGVLKVEDTE